MNKRTKKEIEIDMSWCINDIMTINEIDMTSASPELTEWVNGELSKRRAKMRRLIKEYTPHVAGD